MVFPFPRQPQTDPIREITRGKPSRIVEHAKIRNWWKMVMNYRWAASFVSCQAFWLDVSDERRTNGEATTARNASLLHSCLMAFAVGLEKRRSIKVLRVWPFARGRRKARTIKGAHDILGRTFGWIVIYSPKYDIDQIFYTDIYNMYLQIFYNSKAMHSNFI